VKDVANVQLRLYVFAGRRGLIGASEGEWTVLSVQFTSGTIASVEMQHGLPGEVTTQMGPRFFQAANLDGSGASWANATQQR
jgi:hypothetical protein